MPKGGARAGAGRKSKDEEDKASRLSLDALKTEYGGELEAFQHAAKESKLGGKDGLPYFKLLIEYAYGKPKETKTLNHNTDSINLKELFGFDNAD